MNETKQALEAVVGLVGRWMQSGGTDNDAYQEGCEDAFRLVRTHGPALLAALEDARRWRKLGADCFGEATDHPCLRDDLADWCRNQGMDEAAIDALTAGEQA